MDSSQYRDYIQYKNDCYNLYQEPFCGTIDVEGLDFDALIPTHRHIYDQHLAATRCTEGRKNHMHKYYPEEYASKTGGHYTQVRRTDLYRGICLRDLERLNTKYLQEIDRHRQSPIQIRTETKDVGQDRNMGVSEPSVQRSIPFVDELALIDAEYQRTQEEHDRLSKNALLTLIEIVAKDRTEVASDWFNIEINNFIMELTFRYICMRMYSSLPQNMTLHNLRQIPKEMQDDRQKILAYFDNVRNEVLRMDQESFIHTNRVDKYPIRYGIMTGSKSKALMIYRTTIIDPDMTFATLAESIIKTMNELYKTDLMYDDSFKICSVENRYFQGIRKAVPGTRRSYVPHDKLIDTSYQLNNEFFLCIERRQGQIIPVAIDTRSITEFPQVKRPSMNPKRVP